jgi:hypothetical protein
MNVLLNPATIFVLYKINMYSHDVTRKINGKNLLIETNELWLLLRHTMNADLLYRIYFTKKNS